MSVLLQSSESELDPAFPRLDPVELAAAADCGRRENVKAGATLFQAGDDPLDCFVVVNGAIGVFDHKPAGERQLSTHGPGGFTGEIGLLAGRPALASARALVDSEVIRLDAPRACCPNPDFQKNALCRERLHDKPMTSATLFHAILHFLHLGNRPPRPFSE